MESTGGILPPRPPRPRRTTRCFNAIYLESWCVSGGGSGGGVAWRVDINSIKQLSSFDRISFHKTPLL
jgi:hypothetical protein